MKYSLARLGGLFALVSIAASGQVGPILPAGDGKTVVITPVAPAHPVILTNSDRLKPLPFSDQPDGKAPPPSIPLDLATLAIPSAVRTKVDSGHSNWAKNQGGDAFHASLRYVGGRPILMLFTSPGESAPLKARRLQSVVEACAVHLADDAFDRTMICVAETNLKQPSKVTTHNLEVRRDAFQAALKKCAGVPSVTAALAKVRGDDTAALYQQVCAELGLK